MSDKPEAVNGHVNVPVVRSMDLLDWFAGQALTGIVSYQPVSTASEIAERAYWIAEEMMKCRARRNAK